MRKEVFLIIMDLNKRQYRCRCNNLNDILVVSKADSLLYNKIPLINKGKYGCMFAQMKI